MPEISIKQPSPTPTQLIGSYAKTDLEAKKAEIKAEMIKLEKAAALFSASLSTFGALKAVEFTLPAIVVTQLCVLERAILEYSTASENCAEEVAP